MLTGPPCAHFFVPHMTPDLTSPPQITVRCVVKIQALKKMEGGRRRPSHITHMADTPPVPESTWPLTTPGCERVRRGCVGASPPGLQLALRVRFRASMSAARGCGCRGVCSSEASEASTAGRGAMPLAGARRGGRGRGRAAGGGLSLCMSMSTVHCATAWAGGGGAWELGRTPRTHTHTHTIQKLFAR